jgi:hypothetical protein
VTVRKVEVLCHRIRGYDYSYGYEFRFCPEEGTGTPRLAAGSSPVEARRQLVAKIKDNFKRNWWNV